MQKLRQDAPHAPDVYTLVVSLLGQDYFGCAIPAADNTVAQISWAFSVFIIESFERRPYLFFEIIGSLIISFARTPVNLLEHLFADFTELPLSVFFLWHCSTEAKVTKLNAAAGVYQEIPWLDIAMNDVG